MLCGAAGLIWNDPTTEGSAVHVMLTVPGGTTLPFESLAVSLSLISPIANFATPGRVMVNEGKVKWDTVVNEPDGGTFAVPENGTVKGMSPWGATNLTDASPLSLTERTS